MSEKLRMYFLVMRNIGTIDKGIQAGHCVEEYGDKYHNTALYKEYRKHKTWVILDGGVSNNGYNLQHEFHSEDLGSMELHEAYLIDNEISYASFREPDMNNALTALCFICDERVFDWVNYPIFEKWLQVNLSEDDNIDVKYSQWVKFVGGYTNAKIKELIVNKKLA